MENKRDYAADLAMCERATRGPWIRSKYGFNVLFYAMRKKKQVSTSLCMMHAQENAHQIEDAEFIVVARTALPWYIRKVLELEKQLSNAVEGYRLLKFQNNQQLDLLNSIYDKDKGQYWAWQPVFEENHLESLSCPVLIPAEWLRNLLEEKDAQLSSSQVKVGRLRTALDRIANHIAWMRKDAEAEGAKLDGQAAIYLAGDANYLRDIAKKALSASPAADRWKAMERVVEAARKVSTNYNSDGFIAEVIHDELIELEESIDDLATLEKAGED